MSERNPITIHDYDQFMANADAVAAKLSSSRTAGTLAFLDGSVASFGGYSETFLRHEYQARLTLDAASAGSIQARIVDPLSQTAHRVGVPLLTAGNGLEAPHITLQTLRFGANLSEDEIESMTKAINDESKFNLVASALKDRTILFDRFVAAANGSFYLCSGQVVPETLKARETISKIVSRKFASEQAVYSAGKSADELSSQSPLSLVEFRDITHSVAGRLVAPTDKAALMALFSTAEEIDASLQSDPLEIRIGSVVFGSTYTIMAQEVPGLITNN